MTMNDRAIIEQIDADYAAAMESELVNLYGRLTEDDRCPTCGGWVDLDPIEDYGDGGIEYRGWSCTVCDDSQLVKYRTWRPY